MKSIDEIVIERTMTEAEFRLGSAFEEFLLRTSFDSTSTTFVCLFVC